MTHSTAETVDLDPSTLEQVRLSLSRFRSEVGELEIVAERASRRGNRVYIPVRSIVQPPTMFSLLYAVAGAEVELRDLGLDVELLPEYRQSYIVVAQVSGQPSEYIYESAEGREYDDFSALTGRSPYADWQFRGLSVRRTGGSRGSHARRYDRTTQRQGSLTSEPDPACAKPLRMTCRHKQLVESFSGPHAVKPPVPRSRSARRREHPPDPGSSRVARSDRKRRSRGRPGTPILGRRSSSANTRWGSS